MKSHSFVCCGALLCNAVAAFHIPYFRSPSLWQADATATGPDRKPPSCLDGGPDDVTLYNTSLPSKRSLDDSCGSNRTLVEQAYKDCATMARAGERVARAKNSVSSALLKGIFKDDSDKTRNHVAEHLATIAVECEKNGEGLTPVGCGFCPKHEYLTGENITMAGYAFLRFGGKNGTHQVVLCHVSLHAARHTCDNQILGQVLLHEMSHSWGWTHDRGYAMFAKSAKLGCVVGLCTAGIHPASGEDSNKGNGNGNNNGNGKGNGNDGDNEKGKPKSSAGRQGGSGRASGESLGGEQDGDHSHTQDHDGPCPYRKAIAPHSAVITTAIRPRRSTVIVTVTRPPTSTVIITATGPR
ncbi:hypothetical protein E4U27_004206 [Claviceps purpurea]|nr:hypothetical protein E4U27_004206 [Claviceps purpurea]